jgi:hypothetical protein
MPSSSDEDLLRFETYRNYLHRFASYSRELHPDCESLARACALATRGHRPLLDLDKGWVRRFTSIAWNTESLLAATPVEVDLLRISNAWLPVQAYYAVYSAAEAAAYVIDGTKADGHQKALRKIAEFSTRLGIGPWNLAYTGPKGRDGKQHRPVNFPVGIAPGHNLAGSTSSDVSIIARCLKAEHQNRIKEEYKRSNKRQYLYDPGQTTLFHFLYRLRVRSNYRGIEPFITQTDEGSIRSFSGSLQTVVRRTLCFLEGILLAKCRRTVVLQMAADFMRSNKRTSWLQERVSVYERIG